MENCSCPSGKEPEQKNRKEEDMEKGTGTERKGVVNNTTIGAGAGAGAGIGCAVLILAVGLVYHLKDIIDLIGRLASK